MTAFGEESSNHDSTEKALAEGLVSVPASSCQVMDEECMKQSEEAMGMGTDIAKDEPPRTCKQNRHPLSSKVITLLSSSKAPRTASAAITPDTPSTVPGPAIKTASPKLIGTSPTYSLASRSRHSLSPIQSVSCSPRENSFGQGFSTRSAGAGGGKARNGSVSCSTPSHSPGLSKRKTVFSVMMAAASSNSGKGTARRKRSTTGGRHKKNQSERGRLGKHSLGKQNARGAPIGRTTTKKRKKMTHAEGPWIGAAASGTAERTSHEGEEEKQEKGEDQSRSKEQKRPRRQELGIDQYYLDAGQKVIGSIVCKECGLLYYPGQPEDEKNHKRVHKRRLRAVPFPGWKRESLVPLRRESVSKRDGYGMTGSKAKASSFFSAVSQGRRGGSALRSGRNEESVRGNDVRIVEVLPADLVVHREKVTEVLTAVVEALGGTEDYIASPQQGGERTFFYIADRSVQGVAVVRSLTSAWCVLDCPEYARPRDGDSGSPNPGLSEHGLSTTDRPVYKAQLGVDKIWVHASARRSRVATTLMDSVRSHFFYGFTVPRALCAFSEPTGAGQRFAARYVGTEAFLTYSGDGSSVGYAVSSAGDPGTPSGRKEISEH